MNSTIENLNRIAGLIWKEDASMFEHLGEEDVTRLAEENKLPRKFEATVADGRRARVLQMQLAIAGYTVTLNDEGRGASLRCLGPCLSDSTPGGYLASYA